MADKNDKDFYDEEGIHYEGADSFKYPIHPIKGEIYNRFKEDDSIEWEDIPSVKEENEHYKERNEKSFDDDTYEAEIDKPIVELDNI